MSAYCTRVYYLLQYAHGDGLAQGLLHVCRGSSSDSSSNEISEAAANGVAEQNVVGLVFRLKPRATNRTALRKEVARNTGEQYFNALVRVASYLFLRKNSLHVTSNAPPTIKQLGGFRYRTIPAIVFLRPNTTPAPTTPTSLCLPAGVHEGLSSVEVSNIARIQLL